MSKTADFISKAFYNFFVNRATQGAYWWLEKQDFNNLKAILKNNKDLVPLIKPYLSDENLEKIPPYIRMTIINYLPAVKEQFVEDVIDNLKNYEKYESTLENNRNFLKDNALRTANIITVRLRELSTKN